MSAVDYSAADFFTIIMFYIADNADNFFTHQGNDFCCRDVYYIKDFNMQYSTTEFETLYIQCFPPAMRLAISLLHDEDEARDVVHEVFLKLWESDGIVENPNAYILRSVRNISLSRIRRLGVREKVRLKLMLEPPPDDFDYEFRNEEVKAAVEHLLTFREQQVVKKIYTEGLSYKDAADSLDVSVAAINKNIVRALKKLRTHFKTGKS